jgi:hypothetical protein
MLICESWNLTLDFIMFSTNNELEKLKNNSTKTYKFKNIGKKGGIL